MYFIRYQPLKEKLKSRTLSDREALPYLVLYAVLATVVYLLPTTEQFNLCDWIGGGLSVSLAVGGVIYAYTQNGGRRGFDLIQKYMVIGWVVVVRYILAFIPIAIALYLFGEAVGVMTDDTGWFDVLTFAGFDCLSRKSPAFVSHW